VGSIFKAVDIAVSPSTLPEPFGLVIAEAMAARRPVIATDSGGPSEIIQDRVNGFLIPRNDPVTFSKRLEELIQDPDLRTRVGDAAATRISTKFSAHAFDWEIRAIIECIVFSRPAGRHVRTRRIV
jgi:glycosyltransferase involved in cell wall biosynthesis